MMKTKLSIPFITFLLTLILSFNLRAQNGGFYLRNLEGKYFPVTELNCYTFPKLAIAIPNDGTLNTYEGIWIALAITDGPTTGFNYPNMDYAGRVSALKVDMTKFVPGCITILLWNVGKDESEMKLNDQQGLFEATIDVTRTNMKYCMPERKFDSTKTYYLVCRIHGEYISGYKDEYDSHTKTTKRKPIYNWNTILYTYKLKLNNQAPRKKGSKLDWNEKCEPSGASIGTGNSGSNSTGGTNVGVTLVKTKTESKARCEEEKFDDGKIKQRKWINSEGDQDSLFSYNKKGIIERELRWKDGRKNGAWIERETDGSPVKLETYRNDKLNGLWISYSYGKISEKGQYLEGNKYGTWISYNSDGTKKQEGEYTNEGLKDGLWKIYDSKGKLDHTEIYVKDEYKGDKK